MRQTVTDQWGAGWKVRARHVRGAGTAPPRPGPDADRMRRRLDAAGIPYELLLFEDEGHGIAKPHNRKHLCRRLARFFAEAFDA